MYSLQSRTPLMEKENATSRLMPAKQSGLNSSLKIHSSIKKKTLADVGNTVRDKAVQGSSKLVLNMDQKQQRMKQNVLRDKENTMSIKRNSQLKKTHTLNMDAQKSMAETLDDKFVMPVCHCESNEDELPDFMFKNLKMSKKTVDDLALIWENPIFTPADIRDITLNLSPVNSPVWPESPLLTQFPLDEEEFVDDVPYVF